MDNYQCQKCSTLVKCGSYPSTIGCPEAPSHHWTKLGPVGDVNYQCQKCAALIQCSSYPSTIGCPEAPSHHWTKLGLVGDDNYQCQKCAALIQCSSYPSTIGCPEASSHHWTKLSSTPSRARTPSKTARPPSSSQDTDEPSSGSGTSGLGLGIVFGLVLLAGFIFSKANDPVQHPVTPPAPASPRIERAEAVDPTTPDSKGQPEAAPPQPPSLGKRHLTADEISSWNLSRVRYAINEIYAHYGAEFPNREIQAWADHQPWYHRVPGRNQDMAEQFFTDADRISIEILAARRNALRTINR